MRFIDISLPTSKLGMVAPVLADFADPNMVVSNAEQGRSEIRMVVQDHDTQTAVDRIQSVLEEETDWRLIVLPVDACTGPHQDGLRARDNGKNRNTSIAREEILHEVQLGSAFSRDFIALSILSAIVAALGLNADNVAVVIGAMVIAPLLGPILAFSFAAALGDLPLMAKASGTALAGVAIGIATTFGLTLLIDVNMESRELLGRSVVGLDILALALASGAAAALSLVTGLSATLVGVMVAVALLPPSASIALFLGAGELQLALRALLLLVSNVVCVTIASQIVFIAKGVRPRKHEDQEKAKRSRMVNLVVWGALLIALAVLAFLLNEQPGALWPG